MALQLGPGFLRPFGRDLGRIAEERREVGLEEISDRLLHEPYSPEEIAELLVAFQEVTNYLRSYGESLAPKVYDIFDRVKGLVPTNHEGR